MYLDLSVSDSQINEFIDTQISTFLYKHQNLTMHYECFTNIDTHIPQYALYMFLNIDTHICIFGVLLEYPI